MAVTDTWQAGGSFTAAAEDAVAKAINGSGWLQPCHFATVGTESYTISSGSVTQISGTTLDGGSPSVNDRILVKDAPAATGSGSAFSSEPGNGIYTVTANSSNLVLSRVYEMSATPSSPASPYFQGGSVVAVQAGTVNAGLTFIVTTPNNPNSSFVYGTNNIQWSTAGYTIGTDLTLTGSTLALSSSAQSGVSLGATSLQSAGNVLTLSGSQVKVNSMSTGQAIIGNAGTPTITTLSGDLTVGATGTTTIGAGVITLSKMASLVANSLIGNTNGTSATPFAVPLTATGTASSVVMTDGNSNLTVNSFIGGVATTATAGGTTTLTVSSAPFQQFTGTATQTCILPNATTLSNGQKFTVTNRSSGAVTVEKNGGASLQVMAAGSQAVFTVVSNGTSAGTWDVSYTIAGLTGTVTSVSVATANGFSGSVATSTSTPAISVQTTVTGLLKGNGTAVSAAVSGTDYAPATTGTSILKASSGGFANAVSGTDYAPATPAGVHALASNNSGGFQTATLTMVGAPTANWDIGGTWTITDLPAPVSASDAATKSYVDTAVQGLSAKYSAVAATNTESVTITNGTVSAIAGTTVNGISPNVGDYVLVMNAPTVTGAAGGTTLSSKPANGLYQVTNNSTNLSVSRAADMSGSNNPSGAYVFVESGAQWGGGGYIVTTPASSATFTYGTGSNIAFTQFTGAGEIVAGTGISVTGNTISTSLTAGTAITITGATIGVTAASIGTAQLSATGTTNNTTYHRGDNTWANFASAVGSVLTAGTAITITGETIGVTAASIGLTQLSATGTPSSSTYLRGDNTWATLSFGSTSLSAFAAPTGAISWGGYGITSLANPVNAQDAATKIYVDSSAFHPSCRAATTGVETYTISSGTVTTINGTTIDGVSPSVGDRVLVKDAPASTGTGSVLSSQPGNGIYTVTSNTTNLSISRVADMSSGGSSTTPAGSGVLVEAGTANASTTWVVSSPSSAAAFTYGTTNIQWAPLINSGNVLTRLGNTLQVATMATGAMMYGNANTPTIGAITGDWTVSSGGVVTIGAGAITFSKMANLAGNSVIGNPTGSSTTPAAVAITTSGAASSILSTDSNANITLNNTISGWATTATAGGTTTLTISSAGTQQFTGSSNQTVKLPTTSVVAGLEYLIINASTGVLTVQASGGGTVATVNANSWTTFIANSTAPTTAAGWDYSAGGAAGLTIASGKTFTVNNTLTFSGTDGDTFTFPNTSSDTVATIAASQTLTNKTIAYGSNTLTGLPYDLSLMGFGAFTTRNTGNPTVDNSYGGTNSHATTLSWTHTLGEYATAIVVAVSWYGYAVTPSSWTKSVTVGGHNCTTTGVSGGSSGVLGGINFNNTTTSDGGIDLWGLVLPAGLAGTSVTVSVSYTQSSDTPYLVGVSTSYIGVAAFNNIATNFGSSTALTSGAVTSTVTGTVVSAQAIYHETISSPSGTASTIFPASGTTNYGTICLQSQASTGTSVTLTSTGASSATWGVVSLNMTAVGGGGLGDNPMGISLQRAATLTSVTFRCNTPDVSGNLVCQLNRNGSAISGTSTTIAAASQVGGATTTFSQACSAGDTITICVTGIGTTPGSGLIADITGSF